MSLAKKVKDDFISGTLLIAPLAVTLIIISFLASWAAILINPIVARTRLITYTANNELLAQAIATVLVVVFIIFLGLVSNNRVGKKLRSYLGRFVNFLPLIGSIYLSIQQVASSISNDSSRFKRLVMMEYPKEGVRSIGMVTAEAPKVVQKASDEKLYSVFLPNSPNPTGGRTVMVPESEFTDIDMTVQEGLKLMVTTGMAFDDDDIPETLLGN